MLSGGPIARRLGVIVACTLVAAPVWSVAAAPVDGSRRDDAPGRTAREVAVAQAAQQAAERALTAVQDAFDAEDPAPDRPPGRDLTWALRDLRLGLAALDPVERRTAERLLARPTDGSGGAGEVSYQPGADPTSDCEKGLASPDFCIHFATATADAPPLADQDGNGLPDQVDLTRDVMDEVWQRIAGAGGYRAPLSDADSDEPGPDGRLDIYLADIGADGLYGYCTTDDPGSRTQAAVSAFCVLDDDYTNAAFGGTRPLANLQVTAAHEFFHAVQFAYDWLEDVWFLEGTATWVEDELYDDVNDNRQYFPQGQLRRPGVPLDYYDESRGDYYGSWVFWRFLTERHPQEAGTGLPLLVRRVLERTGGPASNPEDIGAYSTQALAAALRRAYDSDMRAEMAAFAVANRRPRASYEEGAAWPTAPLAARRTLPGARTVQLVRRPAHLSSATVGVVPGAGLTARSWRLRVGLDLPRTSFGYAAAVTVVRTDGSARTTRVRLGAAGDGGLTVGFSRRDVARVEVALVNGSVRYDCWRREIYACMGVPLDDGRPVVLRLRSYRS